MGNKVAFTDSKRVTIADEKSLRAELEQAQSRIAIAETKNTEIRGRINRFVRAVDSIRFNVKTDDAELWMEEWPAFLLSGREPARPEPQPEVSDDFDTQSE